MKSEGNNCLHPREELESVVMEGEAAGVVAMSLSWMARRLKTPLRCLKALVSQRRGEDQRPLKEQVWRAGDHRCLARGGKLQYKGGSFGLPQNPCQPNLVPKWRLKRTWKLYGSEPIYPLHLLGFRWIDKSWRANCCQGEMALEISCSLV